MTISIRLKAALCVALPLILAAPAQAGGLSVTVGQLASSNAMLGVIQMMLASQNQCIVYTYDANGNRLSTASGSVGTATWGASAYPCFTWGI